MTPILAFLKDNGLGPVLFTTYLEAALREVRNNVHVQDIGYADDVDSISKDGFNQNEKNGENIRKVEPKNESHKNRDFQNRIRQRVEKCEKTGHATLTKQEWKRRKQLITTAMLKLKKY